MFNKIHFSKIFFYFLSPKKRLFLTLSKKNVPFSFHFHFSLFFLFFNFDFFFFLFPFSLLFKFTNSQKNQQQKYLNHKWAWTKVEPPTPRLWTLESSSCNKRGGNWNLKIYFLGDGPNPFRTSFNVCFWLHFTVLFVLFRERERKRKEKKRGKKRERKRGEDKLVSPPPPKKKKLWRKKKKTKIIIKKIKKKKKPFCSIQ